LRKNCRGNSTKNLRLALRAVDHAALFQLADLGRQAGAPIDEPVSGLLVRDGDVAADISDEGGLDF
jgi:hypothetical protein